VSRRWGTIEEELHHWKSEAGSLREQVRIWKARWRTSAGAFQDAMSYAGPNIKVIESMLAEQNAASALAANLRYERDAAIQQVQGMEDMVFRKGLCPYSWLGLEPSGACGVCDCGRLL